MNIDGTLKNDISIGMRVSVNPQNDKTRKLLVDGVVNEILTKADEHPHGILVKLEDGTIGRVKCIQANENTVSNEPKHIKKEFKLSDLIYSNETHFVEFKSSVLWSKYKNKEDIEMSKSEELKLYGKNASKFIIAKSLCGFLNSDGGTLVIGVKEVKGTDDIQVVGVDSEYNKLNDKSKDGYRRMILDEVIKPYLPSQVFNHFNDYFEFIFETVEGKTVLGINVKPSDFRVFVHISNSDLFFVRIDASTRKLFGPELVDYCTKRFK